MSALGSRFPAPNHDHCQCVADTLAAAERLCAERKVRLTVQRRRVLEIIAAIHAAIGAYDIIDRLGREGRRPAPISIYRALDFLIEQRFVHRLASLNAYVTCSHPNDDHGSQFLICKRCGTIAEMSSDLVDRAIASGAEAAGFSVTVPIVEVAGVCAQCHHGGDDQRFDGNDGRAASTG